MLNILPILGSRDFFRLSSLLHNINILRIINKRLMYLKKLSKLKTIIEIKDLNELRDNARNYFARLNCKMLGNFDFNARKS